MLPARWPLPRCVCAIGMVLLVAKLALEFRYGPSVRTEQTIGGPVVAVAHLVWGIDRRLLCADLVWHTDIATCKNNVSLHFWIKITVYQGALRQVTDSARLDTVNTATALTLLFF